jgi:leader peptidase (prepilin peptidase)/N-methyltransferase
MELLVCLLFGLVIGSFLNVCIARIPLEESIVLPGSHCPKCQKPIAAYDNIPVLSYLILGGRCRGCKASISARYPGVELLTGVVSVLLFFKFGLSVEWGIYLAFSAALITLAFIDLDHRILPFVITINGIWIGIAVNVVLARPSSFISSLLNYFGYAVLQPRWIALLASLAGAIVCAGFLWLVAEVVSRVLGVEAMGFGDVVIMGMIGAFLGMPLTLLTILFASVLGSIVGGVLMLFGGKGRRYEWPFGTFLAFAGIAALLYGDSLIDWYMRYMFPAV